MYEKLATTLGRKDEQPNIDLAVEICESEDTKLIEELIQGLDENKAIASDCIKVLYEIGFRKPVLIEDYVGIFLEMLQSKNNRMIWGAMSALSTIAFLRPTDTAKGMSRIMSAYERGSVITRDCSISVFAALVKSGTDVEEEAYRLLVRHLKTCRPKEVPQHAERASACFDSRNAKTFIEVLETRLEDLTAPQRKRVVNVLKLLDALNEPGG